MDYFDTNLMLSDEDLALKASVHKFAETVMRPAAKELDEKGPLEAVAEDSSLWIFLRKAFELGYHAAGFPEAVGGLGLTPLQWHIVMEEMGWGSFGLSIQLGAISMVPLAALLSNNPALIEEFVIPYCRCVDGSIRGCWAATDPDHGSDGLGFGEPFHSSPESRSSCRAVRDGDHWVISGQKSAWISGGPVATHCLLYCQTDPSRGFAGSGCAIVPLNLSGCSRGKPLAKLGMKDLAQTELYFDDVRIPARYMILDNPEAYQFMSDQYLACANIGVACYATGLARAAFEEAFGYCNERIQGGRLLRDQYSMKQRIFAMFGRVEACRALTRNTVAMNMSIFPAFTEYAIAAKTAATEMAFQNAHEAIQILGANGLTKEYLPEKLFRDARTSLIADGNTEVLQRYGGQRIFDTYPRNRSTIARIGG